MALSLLFGFDLAWEERRGGDLSSDCKLDIIFNFEKAYFVLDEYLLAGNLQETSKKKV